jgi:hypothetical protein
MAACARVLACVKLCVTVSAVRVWTHYATVLNGCVGGLEWDVAEDVGIKAGAHSHTRGREGGRETEITDMTETDMQTIRHVHAHTHTHEYKHHTHESKHASTSKQACAHTRQTQHTYTHARTHTHMNSIRVRRSCPNYTAEILGWAIFSFYTGLWSSWLFTFAGCVVDAHDELSHTGQADDAAIRFSRVRMHTCSCLTAGAVPMRPLLATTRSRSGAWRSTAGTRRSTAPSSRRAPQSCRSCCSRQPARWSPLPPKTSSFRAKPTPRMGKLTSGTYTCTYRHESCVYAVSADTPY